MWFSIQRKPNFIFKEIKKGYSHIKRNTFKYMKKYSVYICKGEKETGSFPTYGKNYVDAAFNFANNIQGWKLGKVWKKIYRKKTGNPKKHHYLKDETGNVLLLIQIY